MSSLNESLSFKTEELESMQLHDNLCYLNVKYLFCLQRNPTFALTFLQGLSLKTLLKGSDYWRKFYDLRN